MVAPDSRLPPESQPWGRDVEGRLDILERTSTGNAQDIGNTLSAQSATLRRIGQQISDLNDVVTAVQAQNVTILAQQAALDATVANLNSRVAVSTTIPSFNTGTLPGDSTDHFYGTDLSITINVPTGKLLVTIGCGQATVAAGTGSTIAEATFQIPGYANFYDVYSRFFNADSAYLAGGPLAVTRAFAVLPGIYTITGRMSAWSSSGSGASCNFASPYMTVQVTG